MQRSFKLGEYEAVIVCEEHGYVALSEKEYSQQLSDPNNFWKCPLCGLDSKWSDDDNEAWYENLHKKGD